MQGYKQGFHGPWSEIVSFKTPRPRVIQCGDPTDRNAQPQGQPMLSGLVRGTTVTARGLEITITRINSTGTDGWYKGEGWVNVPFLANSSFGVTFESIFINTDREVTRGEIKFMSQPIDEWVDQTIARQQEDQRLKERQKQQEENQEKYADMEFEEDIVLYDKTVIADLQVAADGTVTLVDDKGNAYAAREQEIPKTVEKPLIIEDKNGDQWIVQKGQPPVKVPGGGLPPLNKPLSRQAENLIRVALRELKNQAETELPTSREQSTQALQVLQSRSEKIEPTEGSETDELPSFGSTSRQTTQTPQTFVRQANEYYRPAITAQTRRLLLQLSGATRKDFAKVLGRKSIDREQTLGQAIDTRLQQGEDEAKVKEWVKATVWMWLYETVQLMQQEK